MPNVQPLTIGQGVSITSVSATGGQATYIGRNTYAQGDEISTDGMGTIGGLDFDQLDVPVISATPTQFVLNITAGTVSATTVAGKAIYSTTDDAFPNYITSTTRPTEIQNANIVLTGTNPIVKVPLRIRDKDWWMANNVPTVPTTLPTDLYYNPMYPNGQIYLWPLQTNAYGLELQVWHNLADISDLTMEFFMPPAYWSATTWSLAEVLMATYGVPPQRAGMVVQQALKARATVKSLNSEPPKIVTKDSGGYRAGNPESLLLQLSFRGLSWGRATRWAILYALVLLAPVTRSLTSLWTIRLRLISIPASTRAVLAMPLLASTQRPAPSCSLISGARSHRGVDGLGAFDQAGGATGTGTAVATGSKTPSTTPEFALFGEAKDDSSGFTFTPAAGWSIFGSQTYQQIVNAAINGQGTISSTPVNWAAALVLFKQIGASAPAIIQNKTIVSGAWTAGEPTASTSRIPLRRATASSSSLKEIRLQEPART